MHNPLSLPSPQVVSNVGVSKEKFAYILKSLGPTLPSMMPISRYVHQYMYI